ncbi:MAG: ATP-binding protein [Acidobacteriota bacterium]
MADSEKGPGVCEFDPDALQLKLRTTLAGRTEEIQPVVRQIMGFLKEIGCAEGDAYEIELSVSEALANAVLHGCQGDPEKRIAVCVECDPDRGMLKGERIFFDRGRGIYLINQLMDEVQFDRGGTQIRMRKRDARPLNGNVR